MEKEKTFTEPTKDANYTIKVIPIDNKSWNDTNRMEAVFTLDTGSEKKVFRGLLDLSGIIKKGF